MLVVAQTLWALNYIVTRFAVRHGLDPLAYSAGRYSLAACLVLVFSALAGQGTLCAVRSLARDLRMWRLLALAAVATYINQLSYVYALRLGTASAAALIFGVMPLVTGILAHVTAVERHRTGFWAAAALSFLGIGLVVAGSGHGPTQSLAADGLALAATVSWAVYSVAGAPLSQRCGAYPVAAVTMALAGVALVGTGVGSLSHQTLALRSELWLAWAFGILGAVAIPTVLWFAGIARVGPGRAAIISNLQPVIAALLAVVLLSERLRWPQLVGGAMIIIAILIAQRATSLARADGRGVVRSEPPLSDVPCSAGQLEE
jgi:drug/metabolite transporter (DMT)-like permease